VTHHCDVAIVGGGPTGLTLANILGQAGVRVILIERNAGTVGEPRAVSIDDETLRTMQAVGLSDGVIKDVALDYGSHYFSTGGKCFLKVEPATREYGSPRRNAFTQPKFEATLRRGLERFSSVEALFSHELVEAVEEDDGVSLRVAGPAGREIEVRASYLAACDGARSAIRKQIGATLVGSTYGQRWLIIDLAASRERLRQTRVVCNPARPLITLPGPGGIRRYEFMLRDGEDEAAATEDGFVRNLLAEFGPDADAPIVRKQVYAFHARIADRWNTRRIFLAGDAAHLSPPFAGQGMNSGQRDAHNLGWKLAEVVKGRIGEGLLQTYQLERSPHAWSLIRLAMMMGRIMMPTSRVQAALVQTGFRLSAIAPRVQSYFAQMKYKPKPIYEEGFLLASRDGLKAAGRMLPQPEVEDVERRRMKLDDALGAGFSLVAYGADAQATIHAAASLDFGIAGLKLAAILPRDMNPDRTGPALDHTVRETSQMLSGFLPAGRTVLLLVRPDRYVAAASIEAADAMSDMAAGMRKLLDGSRTWDPGRGHRVPSP